MIRGRRQCDKINGCGKFYNQDDLLCPHCGVSQSFSDLLPFDNKHIIYDLECYPNVFTAAFKHPRTGKEIVFEISSRINQISELYNFLYTLNSGGFSLIGFNNIGYDYPMLHFIIEKFNFGIGIDEIYQKNDSIINTPWENRFDNVVWDRETHIQQIDLFKIHHFDNRARMIGGVPTTVDSVGLKVLEFNMKSPNIEDLPYEPGSPLRLDQIDTLIKYNKHDVNETEKFYIQSIDLINFRGELSDKYGIDFLNHNDTKIGKTFFIQKLENASPGSCFNRSTGKRLPNQTPRPLIHLRNVIFPYIKFAHPEFNRVKDWLNIQSITETKGVFKGLSASVNGFEYDFSTGGIHGSVNPCTIQSDDKYVIVDWDVKSYYPNLAIANQLYPEHLGTLFCDINKYLYEQRKLYDKGTPENAMYKLAINGVYGDTNNPHSPFYDPQYTMSITINGQLLLCMLAEYLTKIPELTVVQINTDGVTIKCPRKHIGDMNEICAWWEKFTCLELESIVYNRMFIRDVNNYIAEDESGKLKRKGAYEYDLEWYQNHNALVVPKAAEAALVHGKTVEEFILCHEDINDFMLCTKVGRADQLVISDIEGDETHLQNITRYYASLAGGSLTKISPPAKGRKVGTWKRATKLTDEYYEAVISELSRRHPSMVAGIYGMYDINGLPWDDRINTKNWSKYEIRRTGINVGQLVKPCNDIGNASRSDIDYNFYVKEAKKLVEPLL